MANYIKIGNASNNVVIDASTGWKGALYTDTGRLEINFCEVEINNVVYSTATGSDVEISFYSSLDNGSSLDQWTSISGTSKTTIPANMSLPYVVGLVYKGGQKVGQTSPFAIDIFVDQLAPVPTPIKTLFFDGQKFAPTTVGSAVTVKFGEGEGSIMTLDEALAKIASSRQNLFKLVSSINDIDVNDSDAESFIYLVLDSSSTGTNNVYAEYIVSNGQIEKLGTMEVDSRTENLTIKLASTEAGKAINLFNEGTSQSNIELGEGLDVVSNKLKVDGNYVNEKVLEKVAEETIVVTEADGNNPLAVTHDGVETNISIDTAKIFDKKESENLLEVAKADGNDYKLEIKSRAQVSKNGSTSAYTMIGY